MGHNLRKFVIILFCTFLFSNLYSFHAKGKLKLKKEEKGKFFFVLQAKKGSIRKADGSLVLALEYVSDKAIYFSDSPKRVAGYISTSRLLENWENILTTSQTDAPNAALVFADLQFYVHGSEDLMVIEIFGEPELVKEEWIFSIGVIESQTFDVIEVIEDPELFIDAGCVEFSLIE